MKFIKYQDLNEREKELIDAAEEAINLAHPPNGSDKKVGAAVRTKEGKIVKGGAFGNESATSNICAEKSVITTANNLGFKNIIEMAAIGHSDKKPFLDPITPCGPCRQVIQEVSLISKKDIKIYCSNQDKDKILITTISELLPHPY